MTAVGRSVGNPACATRGTRSGGSRQILVEGFTHDFGTPPPGAFSQSHDLTVGFFGQPDGDLRGMGTGSGQRWPPGQPVNGGDKVIDSRLADSAFLVGDGGEIIVCHSGECCQSFFCRHGTIMHCTIELRKMTLPCFASGGPGAHRAGHFVGGGL